MVVICRSFVKELSKFCPGVEVSSKFCQSFVEVLSKFCQSVAAGCPQRRSGQAGHRQNFDKTATICGTPGNVKVTMDQPHKSRFPDAPSGLDELEKPFLMNFMTLERTPPYHITGVPEYSNIFNGSQITPGFIPDRPSTCQKRVQKVIGNPFTNNL